jgi:hypothetical protein
MPFDGNGNAASRPEAATNQSEGDDVGREAEPERAKEPYFRSGTS